MNSPYRSPSPPEGGELRIIVMDTYPYTGTCVPDEFKNDGLTYETYDFWESLWEPAERLDGLPVVKFFFPRMILPMSPPETFEEARVRVQDLLSDLALEDGPLIGFAYRKSDIFGVMRVSR